jgi:hypothetical protein
MIIYQTQEQWDNFGQKLCQIFDTEFKSSPAPEPIYIDKVIQSAFNGLNHTEESKELIRQANIGEKNPLFGIKGKNHHLYGSKGPMLGMFGENHPMYGFKMSEHSKELIKQANIGEKNPMFGKKHPTIVCPHCNKSGAQNGMKRWHFNNCRLNKLTQK